jgi:hypothetical protein
MIELKEKTFVIDGEEIEYYPEDTVQPFTESPIDSEKYDNDDVSLDEVLASCGGHFRVSNADILNAKW